MNKYKQFIKENVDNYRYPYFIILIFINSKDDLIELFSLFKNTFNITITYNSNDFENINNHLVLYVNNFYDIIEHDERYISFFSLFNVYTYENLDEETIIRKIQDKIDNSILKTKYLNIKDAIFPNYYYNIVNLLLNKSPNFNSIYNKNHLKSYESLLDKLEGPSMDEIYSNLGLVGLKPKELFKKSLENNFYYGMVDAIEQGFDINDFKDVLYHVTEMKRKLSDDEMYNIVKYINFDKFDSDYLTERALFLAMFNKPKTLELFLQRGADAKKMSEKKGFFSWYEDSPEIIEVINKYKNIPVIKKENGGIISKFKKYTRFI